LEGAYFLVDSGADQSVLCAAFAAQLHLPPQHPPSGETLVGVGGASGYVLLDTVLEFVREDGGWARVQGRFAAFTDPQATDMSVLGRDVLNLFDLILSRQRNDVLLLAPNHSYQVLAS
jgi:hypothetical protein